MKDNLNIVDLRKFRIKEVKMKKLLNFLKRIFSKSVYDISDEDIEEFFKHLRLLGQKEYTLAYFYKWHRDYRDEKINQQNKGEI
jgi:hypothetical protein